MPIEFSCASCNKLLRVPDGTEGKPCQCPVCGTVTTVASAGNKEQNLNSPSQAAKSRTELSQDKKVRVNCPNCQYMLRCVPELIGTKGQCKQCKHIFVIGENRAKAEEKSTLVFSCPSCNQLFDGKVEMDGRKGRCHSCGQVFVIELRRIEPTSAPVTKHGQSDSPPVAGNRQSSGWQTSPPSPSTSTKTIRLKCARCRGTLEVPAAATGQTNCPHCQQSLRIPANGNTSGRASESVFDQASNEIFGGLDFGTMQSQDSRATPSSVFDIDGTSTNTGVPVASGNQPYMYPDQTAYQPAYQPSNYSSASGGYSGYGSPYQSPASGSSSSGINPRSGRAWLRSVASWHKQVIWTFLLQLVLAVSMVGLQGILALLMGDGEPSRGVAIAALVSIIAFFVLLLGLTIWFAIAYIALCLKLYEGGKAALFILGYFLGGCIPFLPLILLIMLLINANTTLKQHGVPVGFLGADTSRL